jgi:hypothetical protein
VGNVLVIYVVLTNKHLRRGNNLFYLNMAISDMVVPLMILPREIVVTYTKTRTWPFDGVWGDASCKMFMFLQNVSPSVSILTLIHMTIDRFCAIVFPTKFNLISTKTRYVMIISTWIIGSVTSSIYLLMSIKKYQGNNFCSIQWPKGSPKDARTIYSTFNLLFYFIIPMALLIILYSIILLKLKAKKEVHSSNMARKRMQTARRVTFMTMFIVGMFGLFWGPTFALTTLIAFHWKWKPPPIPFCSWLTIMFTVRFLPFAHAAVNPFICFLFVNKYRKKVTTALTKARGMASSVLEMGRIKRGSTITRSSLLVSSTQ